MSRVGGRGYPPPDGYDDRPRRRGGRDYQDVEIDVRDVEYRRPPPEFLRENYGRPPNAGPMVVRERSEVEFDRRDRDAGGRSRAGPGRGEREEIDIDIREQESTRGPPRSRRRAPEEEHIDVEIRETSRQPPPFSRNQDREISFRRGEGERRRPRNAEREEIIIRTQDDDPSPPPPRRLDRSRSRVDVEIREEESRGPRPRSRGPSREPERENIDIKIREENQRTGRGDRLTVKEETTERRRSMPPPRAVAREREEYIYRRPRSPSPPHRQTEEIIIRQVRSPSPSPSPPRAPSPPPAPPVEMRPPIVQEVITHHRTIDHGVVRAARSPSSSPSPPPRPKKREDIEIDIRRKDGRGNVFEEDIRIKEDSRRERRPNREDERRITRRKSMESAAPARSSTNEETTISVNIDTDSGGNMDRRMALAIPQRPKPKELWTEVTKDLVSRDAIIAMGYQFEETEDYFYVMEALRYPEVAQLVEVTEDMRYGRKERVEQIQWERQDPRFARDSRPLPRRGPPPREGGNAGWDEITYERDVTYEDRQRRGGYR